MLTQADWDAIERAVEEERENPERLFERVREIVGGDGDIAIALLTAIVPPGDVRDTSGAPLGDE